MIQKFLQRRFEKQAGTAIFQQLHELIEKEKFFDVSLKTAILKLALLSVGFIFVVYNSWMSSTFPELFAWSCLLALILAKFAFFGHDAGHASLSKKNGVNRFFGQITMTTVVGLAFHEWSGRHRAHHQFCQFEEKDPDMHVDLVVSLTEHSFANKSGLGRALSRIQMWTMPWLSLFFGQSQRHLSQLGAFRRPRKYYADIIFLILHFLIWFSIPINLLNLSLSQAVLVYTLPLFILGPYLAAIFWVNHIGMPLIQNVDEFSFIEHQVLTSRNIKSHPIVNWIFGGLNRQIEHHLFPKVPSHQLPKLQKIVQTHLVKNQLPYLEVTWPQALLQITRHMKNVTLKSIN